ncbi:MAG: hypothetical protein IPO70_14950, partial [Bacteroidetes bacterium]|nr:hypothetical protein [Bacteroidota bacterium]
EEELKLKEQHLIKPDFCAPNGVNTTVNMGGVIIDADAFPNFFGTSCAAPHGAAVAALLIEAKLKLLWYQSRPCRCKINIAKHRLRDGNCGF